MADRPFMQFYGSDLVGDTLHLSAEQIGAYMLLLIAMWNAGGSLPSNAVKLARIARCTPARWLKISPDLLELFDADGTTIWHKRVQKEIEKMNEKRAKNARSGSLGGTARALKHNASPQANANETLKRNPSIARATPESEPDSERETTVSPKRAARGSRLPADWSIPNDWGKWAVDEFALPPGKIRAEADRFRDYWIAQPGQKGVKVDWLATWRNWCRTAFASKSGPPSRSARPQSAAELLNEMIEGAESEQSHRTATPAQQHAITGPR